MFILRHVKYFSSFIPCDILNVQSELQLPSRFPSPDFIWKWCLYIMAIKYFGGISGWYMVFCQVKIIKFVSYVGINILKLVIVVYYGSSQQRCSIKNTVLENLCWNLYLTILHAFRPATLLKRHSNTSVFLWILKFLRIPVLKIIWERLLLVLCQPCQSIFTLQNKFPAGIYMLKVNNRNTRTRCEICSELTIKTPGVVLVSLLLTLNIFHTFF